MAHDVFVSYASADKPIADAVCAALEKRKIRCWMAPRDILVGMSYAESIVDAISASKALALVFSANANASNHVKREVERAVSKGLTIIPFRIEDVPLSKEMELYIASTHWLDALTPPLEQHLERLAEMVELLLSRMAEAEPAQAADEEIVLHEIAPDERGVAAAAADEEVILEEIDEDAPVLVEIGEAGPLATASGLWRPAAHESPWFPQWAKDEKLPALLVPDDYAEITQAIEAAQSEQRIIVRPGVYREQMALAKRVAVFGEGPRDQIVLECPDKTCLVAAADEAVVRGLTLRCRAPQSAFAVAMSKGRLLLEDCDLAGGKPSCVAAVSPAAHVFVCRCAIHDAASAGIALEDNARGTVLGCDVFGNASSGIQIVSGADADVRGCRIHHGKTAGILVSEHARGKVDDCEVFGNVMGGMEIRDGGEATVLNSSFHDGEACGIYVHRHGQARIEGCEIFANAQAGVVVENGGRGELLRCRVHDEKVVGIRISQNGRGLVADCDVFANANVGIFMRDSGDAVVRRCKIHHEKGIAVAAHGNTRGVVEDCDISGNGIAGVAIANGADPVIRRCKIHHGRQCGVLSYGNGQGTLEDCEILGNAQAGIGITEGGGVSARHCRINRNGQAGVHAHDKAGGSIVDCDLSRNAGGAWDIDDTSNVERFRNRE